MQYKTITLELLEQHEGLVAYLKSQRQLLQTVECLGGQLRERYLEIQADLLAAQAGGESSETCLQAMGTAQVMETAKEMAIEELQIRMKEFSELPFDDPETVHQFAEMLSRPSLQG